MPKKPSRSSSAPTRVNEIAAQANLGTKSAAMLVAAGIDSFAKLQKLGSVAAFAKVKKFDGSASLNLLWALEGALTKTHWRIVAKEQRTALLIALDDLARPSALRTALREGTREARARK